MAMPTHAEAEYELSYSVALWQLPSPSDIDIPFHQVVAHSHTSSLMVPHLILHITNIHHNNY